MKSYIKLLLLSTAMFGGITDYCHCSSTLDSTMEYTKIHKSTTSNKGKVFNELLAQEDHNKETHEKSITKDFLSSDLLNNWDKVREDVKTIKTEISRWARASDPNDSSHWPHDNFKTLKIFVKTLQSFDKEVLTPLIESNLEEYFEMDAGTLQNFIKLDKNIMFTKNINLYEKYKPKKFEDPQAHISFSECINCFRNSLLATVSTFVENFYWNDSSLSPKKYNQRVSTNYNAITDSLNMLIDYLLSNKKKIPESEIATILTCHEYLRKLTPARKQLAEAKEKFNKRNQLKPSISETFDKINTLIDNLLRYINNLSSDFRKINKTVEYCCNYLVNRIQQVYTETINSLIDSKNLSTDINNALKMINDKLDNYLANFSNYFNKLSVDDISHNKIRFDIDTACNLPTLWNRLHNYIINNIHSSLYNFLNNNKDNFNDIQWLKLNYKLSDNTTKSIAIIENGNLLNKECTEKIDRVFCKLLFNPMYDRIEKYKGELGDVLYNHIYWFLQHADCVASISDITRAKDITAKLNDQTIALDDKLKNLINYKTGNIVNEYNKLKCSKYITFAQYCCLLDNKILSILADFIITLNKILDWHKQKNMAIDDIGKNIIMQMMQYNCKVINSIVIDFKETLKRTLLSDKDTRQDFLKLSVNRGKIKQICLEGKQIKTLKKGLLEIDKDLKNVDTNEQLDKASEAKSELEENEELWKAIQIPSDDFSYNEKDSALQYVFWAYNSFLKTYENIKNYKIQ